MFFNSSSIAFRTAAIMTILLVGCVAGVDAASVYVKTNEAEIRSGTRLTDPIVAKVPRGTALSIVEDGRLRVKVKVPNGQQGYVARTMVQNEPMSSGKGGLGGFVVEDRGPSEMRSAASGRGLMEAAEKMAESEHIDPAAVESVKRMEQLAASISEADVAAFIKQGGL